MLIPEKKSKERHTQEQATNFCVQSYTSTNEITNGSNNQSKRCREAQASTAFLWFGWAGYMASTIISIFMSRSANVNMRGRTGSARRPARPSMAQV
jgi:hypothetical protein